MNIVGLILAGGSGQRLGGVRKADLRLGGQTLLQRVAERLGNLQQNLLISTGREAARYDRFGTCVPDLDLGLSGPLAGIVAAARHLEGRADPDTILISVAVDTPFLPEDYVTCLVDALVGGAQAVQAGWQGNGYPTNAAWRLPALAVLTRQIDAGGVGSAKKLLRTLQAPLLDWGDSCPVDPFANLNTLEDLMALTRRAAADGL